MPADRAPTRTPTRTPTRAEAVEAAAAEVLAVYDALRAGESVPSYGAVDRLRAALATPAAAAAHSDFADGAAAHSDFADGAAAHSDFAAPVVGTANVLSIVRRHYPTTPTGDKS